MLGNLRKLQCYDFLTSYICVDKVLGLGGPSMSFPVTHYTNVWVKKMTHYTNVWVKKITHYTNMWVKEMTHYTNV